MPTRREISDARRAAKHRGLVDAETTATGRLWRACNWLIAEAAKRRRLTEAKTAVFHLIDLLRAGEPLPGPVAEPTSPEPGDGPQDPWYVQVRAPAPSDRRDDVA